MFLPRKRQAEDEAQKCIFHKKSIGLVYFTYTLWNIYLDIIGIVDFMVNELI